MKRVSEELREHKTLPCSVYETIDFSPYGLYGKTDTKYYIQDFK